MYKLVQTALPLFDRLCLTSNNNAEMKRTGEGKSRLPSLGILIKPKGRPDHEMAISMI